METDLHDLASIEVLPRKRRPKPYENILGYILRHTDLIGWEKITWLLEYAKISKDNRHNTSFSFVFDKSLDLTVLGHVTCTDPANLYPMLYPRSTDDPKVVSFFNQRLLKYAITTSKPRICPKCLWEDNYIRAMWDLNLVTCCPIHSCLLVDTCPSCGKKLSWYRNKVSGCVDNNKCRFDFRDIPIDKIDSKEILISSHIHTLLGASSQRTASDIDPIISNLSLNSFLLFVTFFARRFGQNTPVKGMRVFNEALSIDQRHRALQTVVPLLNKWPENFYRLLDKLRSQKRDVPHQYGLTKDFGKSNLQSFVRHIFGGEFQFVRQAFETYLNNWENGYITKRNKWCKTNTPQLSTVSLAQARKILKTDEDNINNWIEQGKLEATKIQAGNRHLIRINRRSIDRLQKERLTWITVKEAALGFCMNQDFVRNLISAKIIIPVSGPGIDGIGITRFRPEEIKRLYHDIFQIMSFKSQMKESRNLICLKKVISIIKNQKCSWSQLIKMILEGRIVPCAIGQNGGLNCFLFDEQQIRTVINDSIGDFFPGKVTVKQASKRLALSNKIIHNLIRVGLLKASYLKRYPRIYAISISSIDKFEKNYSIANKLASQLGRHTNWLNRRLKRLGIKPLSGNCFDGCYITLYRKKDIDAIDLELI